jgi:ABC-type multidrug transport system ATPase subunit
MKGSHYRNLILFHTAVVCVLLLCFDFSLASNLDSNLISHDDTLSFVPSSHSTDSSSVSDSLSATTTTPNTLDDSDDYYGMSSIDSQLPGCEYQSETCVNGYFDSANCLDWIVCNLDPPFNKWYQQHNCTCLPGYVGTDCSIVVDDSYCSSAKPIFDGTPVNINNPNKHLECFVDYNSQQSDFGLRDHRVNLTVELDSAGYGSGTFELISRHRNRTIKSGPDYALCRSAQYDIRCEVDACYGSTNHDNISMVTCEQIDCTSCGSVTPETCSAFLAITVDQLKPPLSFIFSKVNVDLGLTHMQFHTDTLIIELDCRTGECVDSPIDRNVQQWKPSLVTQYTMLFVIGGAFMATILLLVYLCIGNKRKKGDEYKWRHELAREFEQQSDGIVAGSASHIREAYIRLETVLEQHQQSLPRFGLVFDTIQYTVQIPTGRCRSFPRQILHGVTGNIEPGMLVAIIGSSGAGKSSLMDILAAREKTGFVTGFTDVYCSEARSRDVADVVHYVLQDDALFATQTVKEALMFSARMRLPPSYTEAMIHAKVHRLMKDLRIDHIADNRIGHPDKGGGISGGERKRVAIGVELITDPRILMLDEPTSGLDSFSAQVVIEVLQKTAKNGCACLLSIHQPPSKVFAMFDRVILMTRRGQQAFFGSPVDAVEYMQEIGHALPEWTNPAEMLLEVASSPDEKVLEELPQLFQQNPRYTQLIQDVHGIISKLEDHDANADLGYFGTFSATMHDDEKLETGTMTNIASTDGAPAASQSTSLGYQSLHGADSAVLPGWVQGQPNSCHKLSLLCERAMIHTLRDPALLATQMLVTCAVAGVLGGIYWKLDNQDSGIQNRLGLFFFTVLYFALMSMSSIGELVEQRVIFYRERAARFYPTWPYFLSRVLSDFIPLRILPSMAYTFIVYWMVGLRNDPAKVGIFVTVVILSNLVSTGICFTITGFTTNAGVANVFASLIFIFSMLYGGLLMSNSTDNSFLAYLRYVSFVHYGYEALAVNEFLDFGSLNFNPPGFGSKTVTGNDVLRFFGLVPEHLYDDIYVLAGTSVVLLTFGFILLLCSRYRK